MLGQDGWVGFTPPHPAAQECVQIIKTLNMYEVLIASFPSGFCFYLVQFK